MSSGDMIKDLFLTAKLQGERDSEAYARYMRKMEKFIKTILNKQAPVRERFTTLHLYGLADNKIDRKPEVAYYMEKLHEEMIFYEHYDEFNMYEAKLRSEEIADFYISQVAMMISPENLDISAADKETQEKTKKISFADLTLE